MSNKTQHGYKSRYNTIILRASQRATPDLTKTVKAKDGKQFPVTMAECRIRQLFKCGGRIMYEAIKKVFV